MLGDNIIDNLLLLHTRTQEQRMELLKKAEILDENGDFHPMWFSKEFIEYDKQYRLNNKKGG